MPAPDSTVCLNCGAALSGPYCSACGQKAVPPDPSMREFMHETTDELAHWDGKTASTLKALLFSPGRLSIDFLQGRRARWLLPLRLYLICSLALFGTMAIVELVTQKPTLMAGVKLTDDSGAPTQTLTDEQRQRIREGWPAKLLGVERLERAASDSARLNHDIQSTLPKAMFILLPVFAALTSLAWRKKHPRYPAHLYVALHIHAATFLALAILTVATGVLRATATGGVLAALFVAYSAWYVLATFHRVFGDSRPITIVKTAIVGAVYFAVFTVVALGLLAYAIAKS